MYPSAPSIVFHVCAAVPNAKGLGEVEQKSEDVINKYTVSHTRS